jgi:endonuclease/exonuclease/phosphatase family metal-dependent hydrolase
MPHPDSDPQFKARSGWFVLVCLASLLARVGRGQIPMSSGCYSQHFDTLAGAGAEAWTDNVTLPGWYASRSVAPPTITNYYAGAGSSTTGSLCSFGDIAATDRALGSLASGATGRIAFGVRLANDTAVAQTKFEISYTGEQWRVAATNPQTLTFAFQVGASLTNADAAGDQSWTPCPALDFTGPNVQATQALNGNDPANRVVLARVPLPGVVVPPGSELFLRWEDVDDAGYDDGLAVDELSVSFQPPDCASAACATNGAWSLLTCNTHGNQVENWSTNTAQVRALGRQLAYLKPDVITLNEIPDTNTWQMANWVQAFLPGYFLATNSASDGAIRNVILSRFPINRSQSWLHDADLTPFGRTNASFKRDLFEAEIAVPDFPLPLHVFCLHLKSGQDAQSSAWRGAEARAVSNFLATAFLPTHPFHPYVLSGDLNEDLSRPPASFPQSVQQLMGNATGLQLTTPLEPRAQNELTFSIQSGALSRRYDYILPCALLGSNLAGAEVFRTDWLTNEYPRLRTNDSRVASDHLPVLAVFANPYRQPFRLLSIACTGQEFSVSWESLPGQSYSLERATLLTGWTPLGEAVTATGAVTVFKTNRAPGPEYFRVKRIP